MASAESLVLSHLILPASPTPTDGHAWSDLHAFYLVFMPTKRRPAITHNAPNYHLSSIPLEQIKPSRACVASANREPAFRGIKREAHAMITETFSSRYERFTI